MIANNLRCLAYASTLDSLKLVAANSYIYTRIDTVNNSITIELRLYCVAHATTSINCIVVIAY